MKINLIALFILSACSNNQIDGIHVLGSQKLSDDELAKSLEDTKADYIFVSSMSTYESNKVNKEVKADTTFIPGANEDKEIDVNLSNNDFGDMTPLQEVEDFSHNIKSDGLSNGPGILGAEKTSNSYVEYDAKGILEKARRLGESRVEIKYYYSSDFEVNNDSGRFGSIFESDKSQNYGPVLIHIGKYFNRGVVESFYGVNLGALYFEGRGRFVTGELSDATFTLWTIPLDFALGAELNFGGYAKLSVMGGPSVMALLQSRSDFDEGNDLQKRRQLSPGYFAGASFKFSLSQSFKSYGFKLYRESNVTQMFLSFDMRIFNYSSFKDDIEVEGLSVGSGLTFEYF